MVSLFGPNLTKKETSRRIKEKETIVFEDTIHGIRSAKNAGMKVIAITTTCTREELKEADHVVDDFTEMDMETLVSVLGMPD